jgi:hypothetical protein
MFDNIDEFKFITPFEDTPLDEIVEDVYLKAQFVPVGIVISNEGSNVEIVYPFVSYLKIFEA